MSRIVLGAVAALLFVSAGMFWWQGRAAVERGAPPPDLSGAGTTEPLPIELPSAGAHARGAALPGNGKAAVSREERRFARYDRNRDGSIARVEMLSTRVKSFQKLDTNHDNLLSFEEWAVKTSSRFRQIDRNADGIVSRAELDDFYRAKEATAKAKRARCSCPATTGSSDADPGEPAD